MTIFEHKIAYISDQHLPVQRANSEQVMNTISALAAEGIQIDLVVPNKWRNLATSKAAFKKTLLEFYHIKDGFDVTRLLHLPFAPFKLDKLSHGLLGPIYASTTKHDLIYTRNSLPALLALALRKKLIFEAYRVYEDNKSDTVKLLAKHTYSPNFLGIFTHSTPSRESLIQAGAIEEKVKVVPNGFNPAPLTPPLTKLQARRILGWNEFDKIACYTGRIEIEKGAFTILELAERTPDIDYFLIGKSESLGDEWILKTVEQKALKNVKMISWVTPKELSKYLYAADVLIIPPTAKPMQRYGTTVLPIKTFIYMAVGRCILAPDLPDTANVLNKKNAVLIEPDNLDSAQKAMRRIFEDKAWASSIAKQAKLDSKNYTWQHRARKIITFLNERLTAIE